MSQWCVTYEGIVSNGETMNNQNVECNSNIKMARMIIMNVTAHQVINHPAPLECPPVYRIPTQNVLKCRRPEPKEKK